MKRREFVALLGSVAVLQPLIARAQQPAAAHLAARLDASIGRMHAMRQAAHLLILTLLWLAFGSPAFADAEKPLASIAAATKGFNKHPGFLPLYTSREGTAIYIEIPTTGTPDLLYQPILASGFGITKLTIDGDILDRGYLAPGQLVTFRPYGNSVLLVRRNTSFYTPSAAFGAAGDSGFFFPDAVVATFKIEAKEGERLLIDATDFFALDAIGIPAALEAADQGKYAIDKDRTVVDLASATASKRSIEVESLLTFTTSDATPDADILEGIAADRTVLMVRERHLLIRLPDDAGYRPRPFDPRSGYFDNTYNDPSRLPGQPARQSYIVRHRLNQTAGSGPASDLEQPIIFYIDPSVPRPFHALIEEAVSWWAPAFEAAGFRNALKVMDLPRGVDPLAAGVNIVLWVPRSTHGSSFGDMVTDPRTGEVQKAVVRLDATVLRAEEVLFDALTAPYNGRPDLAARDEFLRKRFLLLVAHEVGHALGLRHQYIGHTRTMTSVMDYPFPSIVIDAQGVPKIASALPTGIGTWDRQAILYGYRPFPPDQELDGLKSIIEEGEKQGLWWMTDPDSGDIESQVQLWDSDSDPIAALDRVLAIRRAALARFSRAVIPPDQPLGILQDALSPVYLLHRSDVKAVAAVLGGGAYRQFMRDQPAPEPVSPALQRAALKALLVTLDADVLAPDPRILTLMLPRPASYSATRAAFPGDTGAMFDSLRPVQYAAAITMRELLKPSRAARLAEAATRDPDALDLDEVLSATISATWKSEPKQGPAGAAQRAIAETVVACILWAVADQRASEHARGAYLAAIEDLKEWMKSRPPPAGWKGTYALARHEFAEFEQDPKNYKAPGYLSPVLDPLGEFR